jgi:hypothetical protein
VFDPTEFDAKTDPVVADKVVIQDTEANDAPKVTTITNLAKATGERFAGANATSALSESNGVGKVNIGSTTANTDPAPADKVLIETDGVNKSATITNLVKAIGEVAAGTNATSSLSEANGVMRVNINGTTGKDEPVAADAILLNDSENGNINKSATITNLAKPIGEIVAGTNATSGLSEVDGVCRVNISGVADKTAPVAADSLLMNDSENGNINKEVTAANLCKALAGTLAGVEATNGLTSSAGVLTVAAKIAHLEAALLKGTTVIPMSFETGEQMALKVYFNHKVTIDKIRGIVTTAIAGTDDGTITAANGDGDMATGVLTATAGDPLATEYFAIPTTNNVIAQDGYVSLTSAKATAGGRMLVTLEWTRTA